MTAHSRTNQIPVAIVALTLALAGVLFMPPAGPAEGSGGNSVTSPDTTGFVGYYTSLELDASGNPVVSYLDLDNADLKVIHCGNADCSAGNTITSPDTTGSVGTWTSLILDAAGNPVVSYVGGGDLKLLHCGNPDCTAGNSVTAPDTTAVIGGYTSIALDASGNPVVSYFDQTNADLKLLHCGNPSCTAGNSITAPDTADYVGTWTSLELDASGNPVVSYRDTTIGGLKLLRCGNANCTAGNNIALVDTGSSLGQATSLALDAVGDPVVSYADFLVGDLKVVHCGNATCTSGNSIAVPDTFGLVGEYTSLALDIAGNPVISYYDATGEDLKVLRCGDPNCTSGNSITSPDTTGVVGRYTSIELDAAGNPVVSYLASPSVGDLKVLHCGNPNCSPGSTITAPDTAGQVGLYTSLELEVTGDPVVSYYDFTNRDLKVVHCGNPNCTSAGIAAPDTAGDVGAFTSLALDVIGNPVVSYYDATNGDLKLLYCGNTGCTAGNSIATPDTAGDVGLYTSIVLDASGNPVVSYYDASNGHLKLLHCGNANCTAGNSITSPDTAGDTGYNTSLALDSGGNPVVSYQVADGYLGETRVLHCGDPNCAAGNSIRTLNTAGFGTSLALDASGNPVVSFHHVYIDFFNNISERLTVVHCGNSDCTAGNSTAIIAMGSGQHPSIALDASGNPVVSYGGNTLRIIYCSDANCSSGNTTSLFDLGTVSYWTSMALDGAGNPVVSYYASSDLNVLHCVNSTCSPKPASAYTPAGSDVAVQVGDIELTFENVTGAGTTTVTASGSGTVPPSGFQLSSIPVYYDISTTSTFTGDVKICINYDDNFTPSVEAALRLLHEESAVWVDVTNDEKPPNPDTVNNILCGVATSFSEFVSVELIPGEDYDGDGCANETELGLEESAGGLRDPLDPNDYYDVLGAGGALTHDGVIDLANDILGVIQHYAPTGAAPYDVRFDRGPSAGPNPWNMTAPDGVIDLPNDILGVILQFNHNCI